MIPIKDRRRRIIPVVNTSKRKIIDQKTVDNDPIQNKSPFGVTTVSPTPRNIAVQHHNKISPLSKTCQKTPPSQNVISSNFQELSPNKTTQSYVGSKSKFEQVTETFKSPYKKVIPYNENRSLDQTDKNVLSPGMNKSKNISLGKDEIRSIICTTPQRKPSESKDNMNANSDDQKVTNKNIEEAKDFIMQQRRFPEKTSTSLDVNIRPALDKKIQNRNINARKTPDGNTKIFILSPAELKDMGINLDILDMGDENKLKEPDEKNQLSKGGETKDASKLRSADVKKCLLKKLTSKNKISVDEENSKVKVSSVPHTSVIQTSKSPAKQIEHLPAESTPKSTNMQTATFIKNYLIFSPKEGISNYIEGYSNIQEQMPQKNAISVSTNIDKPRSNCTEINQPASYPSAKKESSNKTTLVDSKSDDDTLDIDGSNFIENMSFELPDINSDDDIGIFDLSSANLEDQNTNNSVEQVDDSMQTTEIIVDSSTPNVDHENMPPFDSEQISPSGAYKNIEILFKSLSKSIIVSENGELIPVGSTDSYQVDCQNLMNLQEADIVTSTSYAENVKNTNLKILQTPKQKSYQKGSNSLSPIKQKNVVFEMSDEEDVGSDKFVFNPLRQKIKQYMSPKALKSPQTGNIQCTHGADPVNNKFLKNVKSSVITPVNIESFKDVNTPACSITPVNIDLSKGVNTPACSITPVNIKSLKGVNTSAYSITPVNIESLKAADITPACSITPVNIESPNGVNTPACSIAPVNIESLKGVNTPACSITSVNIESFKEEQNSVSGTKSKVEDNCHSETNTIQGKSNIQPLNKNLDEARMKIIEMLKTFHSMPKENKFVNSHKNISSIYEDDSNGSEYEDDFSEDQLTSESLNIESNGNSDAEDSSLKSLESENNQNFPENNEPEFVQTNSESKNVVSIENNPAVTESIELANNNSSHSESHIIESAKTNKNIQIINVQEIKDRIIIPPLKHAEIVETIQPTKFQTKINTHNVQQILIEKSPVEVMEDATPIHEPISTINFSDVDKNQHIEDSIDSFNNSCSRSIQDNKRVLLSIQNIEDVKSKCDMKYERVNFNATCNEIIDSTEVILDVNQINTSKNISNPDKTNSETINTNHLEKIAESVSNSNPLVITEQFHNENETSENIISAELDSRLSSNPNENILDKEQNSGKDDTSEDEEIPSDSLYSVTEIIEEDEDDSKILDVQPVAEILNSLDSGEWKYVPECKSLEFSESSTTLTNDRDILHQDTFNYADEILSEKDASFLEETKEIDNQDSEKESESADFSDSSNTFTIQRDILHQKKIDTNCADEIIGKKDVTFVEETTVNNNQDDCIVTYSESSKIENSVSDISNDNETCNDLIKVNEEIIPMEIEDSVNATQTVSKQVEEMPEIMVAGSDNIAIETAQSRKIICSGFDADHKLDVTIEDEEIAKSKDVDINKGDVVEKSHDLNIIDKKSNDNCDTSVSKTNIADLVSAQKNSKNKDDFVKETCSNKRKTRKSEINIEKKYVSQRLLNKKLSDDSLGGTVLSNASKRKRMSYEFEEYNHKSVKKKKPDSLISPPSVSRVVPETSTPVLKKKTRKRIIVESDSSDEEIPLSVIASDKQSDSGISDVSKTLHDSKDTAVDKSEKSDHKEASLILPKGKVKCGVCSVIVKTSSWDNHSLNKHYYLAWVEGEEPLNIASADQLNLVYLLNKAIKANKKLECALCGIKKASSVGYLTHINTCKKTPEEIEAYKVLCTVCNQRVLPSSFAYHTTKHAQEEYNKKVVNDVKQTVMKEEEETLDLTKRKRRAAAAAEKIFKNIGKEVTAELVNVNTMYTKGYAPKSSNKYKTMWRNQICSTEVARCPRRQCSYVGHSLEDIIHHYVKSCEYITKRPFVCKVCREEYEDQEGVEEHIKSKHSEWTKNDRDFEESEESSESENTEDDDNVSDCSNDSEPTPRKKSSNKSGSVVKSTAHNIGSILEGPFRFSFDEPRCTEKSLRSTIGSWVELLQETILGGENLFSQYPCNDYIALHADEIEAYFPDDKESCNVSHLVETSGKTQNIKWTKYRLFQSELTKGIQTFWCGGPIYAIDFVPSLYDNAFVAISAGKSLRERYSEIELYSHKELIQIWDLGILDDKNGRCVDSASMAFAIAHEHGVVWDLSWCPSGCCDYSPEDRSDSSRMGLLAVACSDGQAYIYAVCHPDKLPQSDSKIWKTDPIVQLCLVSNPEEESMLGRSKYQATKICWSQDGLHNIIVVGYSNGIVAYYDITTLSRLLSSQRGNTKIFQPYKTFQAQPSRITGLALLPQFDLDQEAPLAVSSFSGCNIWRGDQLTFSRPGTFNGVEIPMLFPEITVFSEQVQPSYTRSYTIPLTISNGIDSKWMNTHEGCQVSCLMTHSSTVYSASYQGYVSRQCYKSPFIARHRTNKSGMNNKFLCWYMHAVKLNTESLKLSNIKSTSRFNSKTIKESMQGKEVSDSLSSYKDTTDNYGLLIVDVPQNTILQHTDFLNIPSYRMWPLWEQLCMKSLLMNEKYSNFAISGSRAGFCRVAYVPPVTI